MKNYLILAVLILTSIACSIVATKAAWGDGDQVFRTETSIQSSLPINANCPQSMIIYKANACWDNGQDILIPAIVNTSTSNMISKCIKYGGGKPCSAIKELKTNRGILAKFHSYSYRMYNSTTK
jgi:hypothetical protein